MSFPPPREVSATIDENQLGVEGGVGGESEGGDGNDMFNVVPSPSLDMLQPVLQPVLQKWKRATLLVDANRRFRYTLDKEIVADVSKSVLGRYRTVVLALRAVQRFKEAGQKTQRNLQGKNPCLAQSIAQCIVQNVLYQGPYPTERTNQQCLFLETVCACFTLGLVLAVFILSLRSKIVSWPVETHFHITEDLPEIAGEGVIVTCESFLMSAKDLDTNTTGNMCSNANKLETVTVVVLSDMAKAVMDEKIEKDSSRRPITKVLEGGFSVTQEAYDRIELLHSTVQAPLTPLFPGGKHDDKYIPIEYLQHLLDFPQHYLRLSLVYDCNNCISCSLEVVENLSRSVVPSNEASWVSCGYYGGRANKCRSRNRYTGKCKLYPTEKLPPIFAIRNFLEVLNQLSGIRDIRAPKNAHRQKIKLDPGVLYLNISHALSSSIVLRFMEVEKGSSTWTILLSSFPSVKKDCTELPRVPVCNGTSVCNMFRSADSYELRCLDFRNHTQCKLLLQHNVYIPDYKAEQTNEILCPTAFNCMEEAPYLVVWKTPESMENDALNSFVGSKKLNEEWTKRSGVCTNTYKNVIRYHPPTADGSAGASAKSENMEMFYFESKCTQETSTQPSYCVPTGRYHTLSDNPGADWKYLRDLSLAITTRVKWKRVKRMGFGKWYIPACGYVLGWTGSAILALKVVFAIFCFVRPFLAQLPKPKLKRR